MRSNHFDFIDIWGVLYLIINIVAAISLNISIKLSLGKYLNLTET